MSKLFFMSLVLIAIPALAALEVYNKPLSAGRSAIRFYKEQGMSEEQFSQSNYNLKPDPAWLQKRLPLTEAERLALQPEDFKNFTQEEIDQIYIRASSGAIIPGQYKGSVVQRIELLSEMKKKLPTKFGPIDLAKRLNCDGSDKAKIIDCFAESIWSGKEIFPRDQYGQMKLLNAIKPDIAKKLKSAFIPFFDNFKKDSRIEPTIKKFFNEERAMLFPAKVYCAQSLFDHRRESIVIDYAWGSDWKSESQQFIKGLDNLAGREYLMIRDEVRMIRPGLYLGRAYTNKIFLLNFVLHSPEIDNGQLDEARLGDQCFNGKHTR